MRLIAALLAFLVALAALPAAAQLQNRTAIFAGGCFWSVEANFDRFPGVTSTVSGYIGGRSDNPTYFDHSVSGHREAVRIEFDPRRVNYDQLVFAFFRSVDPTDAGGQFCDRGHSYTTAIYVLDEEQKAAAEQARTRAERDLGQPVVTEILDAPDFWPAEEYHQDFHRKDPLRYALYSEACGREDRLREIWGDAAHARPGDG